MTFHNFVSKAFDVTENRYGVAIRNLTTGDERWLQGDDANQLSDELDRLAAVTEDEDRYHGLGDSLLGEYFA